VEPVPNISGSAFDPHFVRLFLKPVIYTSTLAGPYTQRRRKPVTLGVPQTFWGTLMLFSPEPKTRRQDLYDFDRELSRLVTALRAEGLTPISITTHGDGVSVELNSRFLRYVNGG